MTLVTWREVRYGQTVTDDNGEYWKVGAITYWKWINQARVPTPDAAFADGMSVALRGGDDAAANVEVDPNAAVNVYQPVIDFSKLSPPDADTQSPGAFDAAGQDDPVDAAAELLSEPLEAEGGAGAVVVADEDNETLTAAAEATVFQPFDMPPINEISSLLSHLYLVHGMSLTAEAIPEEHLHRLDMLHQLHLQSHKSGPLPNVHTHTKEA